MKFFESIGVIFQPRYISQILEWTVEFTDYNTASFIRNPPLPLSMTGKITILKGSIISKKNTIFWVLLVTSLVIRHFEILQKVAVIQIPFFHYFLTSTAMKCNLIKNFLVEFFNSIP